VATSPTGRSRTPHRAIRMTPRRITPVQYHRLVRVFELDGFVVKREKGDHMILTKTGVRRPVVIKKGPREVPVTHILTNLKTAGISRDQYFKLLDQV